MMMMMMMVVFLALQAGDAFTEYHTTAACVFPLLRPRQFPGQQAYPQDEHAVESLGSLCWDWTVVMWGTPWYTDWAACHRCKEIPHRPELPIPSMSVKQMLGAQRCSNFLKFWKHCGFLRWFNDTRSILLSLEGVTLLWARSTISSVVFSGDWTTRSWHRSRIDVRAKHSNYLRDLQMITTQIFNNISGYQKHFQFPLQDIASTASMAEIPLVSPGRTWDLGWLRMTWKIRQSFFFANQWDKSERNEIEPWWMKDKERIRRMMHFKWNIGHKEMLKETFVVIWDLVSRVWFVRSSFSGCPGSLSDGPT